MKIAWQSWVLIALAVIDFAISQALGAPEFKDLPAILRVILFPAASLACLLAGNQLKALGGPPPNVPLTERTMKPPQ